MRYVTICSLVLALIMPAYLFAAGAGEGAAEVHEIRFLFPVQLAGDLAGPMEEIAEEFNQMHDDIQVNVIFTGDYANTADRIRTSVMAGNPPHVAITDIQRPLPLREIDAVVDLTPYIEAEPASYYADFVDGFKRNFEIDGEILGMPFQHSVPLMYYNKDLFAEVGLDPDSPPTTWSEILEAGETFQSEMPGVIPLAAPAHQWILQGIVEGNGGAYSSDFRTPTLTDEPVVEAVEFLADLIHNRGIMRIRGWGESTEDFLAQDVAMIYNSTGSMGFIRTNATFDWGVAPMPRNRGAHSFPYGGGGLFLLKGHDPEVEEAAWRFIQFLTSPEITARWSILTGYFAVRESALERSDMREYMTEFPQAAEAYELMEFTNAQWVMERNDQVDTLAISTLEEILVLNAVSAREGLEALQRQILALYD